MYPLTFKPIFKRYIWGGHRLGSVLDKPIGEESCAESWELVDHGQDQSVVESGPLAGKSLAWLVANHGEALLGPPWYHAIHSESMPGSLRGRFPLLLKFLDASQSLSVQVHPDDAMAATLDPPDLGKTEAWYVMDAEPNAKIYAGLKPSVSRAQLANAIAAGTTEELLHSFQVQTGDCIFIRAGTLHAIGAGLLIAEIQQASNTTFRVFDWNRVDANGQSRELHIEQSLSAIDFALGPVNRVEAVPTGNNGAEFLVSSAQFELTRRQLAEPVQLPGKQLRILAVVSGAALIGSTDPPINLQTGSTALIPYDCKDVSIEPVGHATLLEITLPNQ